MTPQRAATTTPRTPRPPSAMAPSTMSVLRQQDGGTHSRRMVPFPTPLLRPELPMEAASQSSPMAANDPYMTECVAGMRPVLQAAVHPLQNPSPSGQPKPPKARRPVKDWQRCSAGREARHSYVWRRDGRGACASTSTTGGCCYTSQLHPTRRRRRRRRRPGAEGVTPRCRHTGVTADEVEALWKTSGETPWADATSITSGVSAPIFPFVRGCVHSRLCLYSAADRLVCLFQKVSGRCVSPSQGSYF